MTSNWVVDCAGARMGGAARFLTELDDYLLESGRDDVRVVGRNRPLTPAWLVEREYRARGSSRRVALNNVAFSAGTNRVVLLRNALHFSDATELRSVGYSVPPTLHAETRLVRAATRRASRIIVPCSEMRDRVAAKLPRVSERIEVRFHPVTPMARDVTSRSADRPRILVPILPAPYKQLDRHLAALAAATAADVQVVITADPCDVPSACNDPRFEFIGRRTPEELAAEWYRAAAIYFPTVIESFGYPLAEARALGRRIIALDTSQNREIAGPALAGFAAGDANSLTDAVAVALSRPVLADPNPFDRDTYFDWLLAS